MNLFELNQVTYFYPDEPQAAILDLSLQMNEGEFVLVIGSSASGKSTFVKLLSGLIPSFYGGKLQGKIYFKGKLLTGEVLKNGEMGMLFQNPERQIVTDLVERELVYGMENLGMPRNEMRKRFSEMVQYFNLRTLIHRSTHSLSGGEKQKVVLASVLAMGCRILILDEPTSELDPVTAEEVFALLKKLHQDFGYTVILVEHRSDECFALAERVLFFDKGQLKRDFSVSDFLHLRDAETHAYLPKVSQIFTMAEIDKVPVSISEGRKVLKEMGDFPSSTKAENSREKITQNIPPAISFDHVCFQYERKTPFLERLNLTLPKRKSIAIVGENGAGKSTLLKLAVGMMAPQFGEIRCCGRLLQDFSKEQRGRMIGYVGQQPDDYLIHDRVFEECAFTLKNFDISNDSMIQHVLSELGLSGHTQKNPRDLSFSERLRVAIASLLVLQPEILLLDEPVRGLDPHLKQVWGEMFRRWVSEKNRTVIFATQDIDFAAEFSDHLIWMSAGGMVDSGPTHVVLENNLFFIPQASRLFQNFQKGIWTMTEAVQMLKHHSPLMSDGAASPKNFETEIEKRL